MLITGAQELHPSHNLTIFHHQTTHKHFLNIIKSTNITLPSSMHSSLFPPLSLSPHHHHFPFLPPLSTPVKTRQNIRPFRYPKCLSTFVEQLACTTQNESNSPESSEIETNPFEFEEKDVEETTSMADLQHPKSPGVEVQQLEELPEQWRRAKLAWLCKELPSQKAGTLVRLLNAERKWMRQDDATYMVVHFLRVRKSEAGFRVYKWMVQQHWYRFNFALATKIADQMGKEGKVVNCREIFDDIINKGRVPSESTFHTLVLGYLSGGADGSLEDACDIYNRMIHLGGYLPQLSLHNLLFRVLVSKLRSDSKQYLKQAEVIYHNMVTSDLEVSKDIYAGLIWLHSHQDDVDMERIVSLREGMKQAGIEEGKEVLVSFLRACSKAGSVEEAESTWHKLLEFEGKLPPQAFVYKMEVYANVGHLTRALEIFREMQEYCGSANVAAYHLIIKLFSKAQEREIAETLMQEFIKSGMQPLMPSVIDMMNMYFGLNLHNRVESVFSESLETCPPDRTIYSIYLDSLVEAGNLEKAEKIFNHMYTTTSIGVDAKSCNTILRGYLSSGDHMKVEKVYDLMRHKKYDIESSLMEKLNSILSLTTKAKKPVISTLSKEQREILVGLSLGGLQIESDENRKRHMLIFEFKENSVAHSVLRRHLYDLYHEWLHPSCRHSGYSDAPYRFATIAHSCFGFYAEQFWPNGQPTVPKLVHRWLTPQALAYWYMYGGHLTSSGDILLKLKGSRECVDKVVKAFKARSLSCRVKRKGRVFWVGFPGADSWLFWDLVEPFVLEDLKDSLKPGSRDMVNDSVEAQSVICGSGSGFESEASE